MANPDISDVARVEEVERRFDSSLQVRKTGPRVAAHGRGVPARLLGRGGRLVEQPADAYEQGEEQEGEEAAGHRLSIRACRARTRSSRRSTRGAPAWRRAAASSPAAASSSTRRSPAAA